MSIKVMSKVWDNSALSGTDLLLMLALADYSDDSGHSFPSVPTLAKKIRMSDRHTIRKLKALEAAGEIAVDRSKARCLRESNDYQILKSLGKTSSFPVPLDDDFWDISDAA